MKRGNLVLILLLIASVSGGLSFVLTRKTCGPSMTDCKTMINCKADLPAFKAQTIRLAQLLELETSTRDQIINQAHKVFEIRQNNILAAADAIIKSDANKQTIIELLPCPMDKNNTNQHLESDKCCVGPGCCCKFEAVQSQKIMQSDPEYLEVSYKLRSELAEARQLLVSTLNDRNIAHQKIILALKDYLEKSNALEIRAIEYFITIRPHLTAEQRKQIFCWCTQSIQTGTVAH